MERKPQHSNLKHLGMLLFIVALLFFTVLSYAAGVGSVQQAVVQNKISLLRVNSQLMQDGQIQVCFDFSDVLTKAPVVFTTQEPARLILDFPGVANQVQQNQQTLNLSFLQDYTVVQADNRTRVIFDLKAPITYQLQNNEKSVVVTLSAMAKVQSASPSSTVATKVTHSAIASLLNPHRITAIDFRRGENGSGRIVIGLSDNQTSVDLDQEGQQLNATFLDTRISAELQCRLDVTDFGTPVQLITTQRQGNHVQMLIDVDGHYTNTSYQIGKQLIIEISPVSQAEQLEKQQPHYTGKRITLNFQDISVRAALQLISDFTGINIVVSDTVQGNMTLHLQDVPWDQALATILSSQGLGKRQVGNVIFIASEQELSDREKKELQNQLQVQALVPLYSELIQINYAKAVDLAALLKNKDNSLLGLRGTVSVDERTNSLWVQDTPDKLKEIKDFISKLDVPVRQVSIESRIINIDNTFEEDLGVRWGVTGFNDTSGTLNGANVLAGGGAPSSIPVADRLNVDFPATPVSSAQPASVGIALAKFANNAYLDLELSALETEGHAKIISSPRLITSNQQAALIQQGTEIPYEESTSSGATSTAFKEAVLALRVTPQITPDNRLILKLQVNEDKPEAQAELGQPPAISTQEIRTQVLVDNGQTIVLGGIYEQTDQTTVTRVPFLGTLPVIGVLFRSTQIIKERTELLIFITPKIVEQSYVQ